MIEPQPLAKIEVYLADLLAARPTVVMTGGLSPKGAKTLRGILDAAERVFIRDGHAGLSLRRVALEAGVAVGNVNYYFASRRALIEATLREAFAAYVEAHITQFASHREAPIEVLLNVLAFYIESARRTHRFFFQLWSYATTGDEAQALVGELYRPIGRFVYYLVRAARPDADDARAREITLQLASLEEGVKLLIGLGPRDDQTLRTAETHLRALARRLILAD